MHARPVHVRVLGMCFVDIDLLPGLAIGRRSAIADAITAGNQHTGMRPAAQQLGQRAHEHMVAPAGFQIAVDEGNHFILAAELELAQLQRHAVIRGHQFGVDAIVNHRDARAEGLGKGAGLPVGGRDGGVGQRHVHRIVEVAHLHPTRLAVGVAGGEFRVKADIAALQQVIKLAVQPQPRLRPDLLEKQAFAPAGMGDDHIGLKTLFAQLQRRPKTRLTANHLGVKVTQPGVYARLAAGFWRIAHDVHTLPLPAVDLAHGQRHHGVLRLGGQRGRQMLELAGKVLVNKQDLHKWASRVAGTKRYGTTAIPCKTDGGPSTATSAAHHTQRSASGQTSTRPGNWLPRQGRRKPRRLRYAWFFYVPQAPIMKVLVIPVTSYQQNCSLIWCEHTHRAALVDPGGDVDRLLAEVEKRGLTLERLLITHGHLDHAGGVAELTARLGLPVEGPHQADQFWLDGMQKQAQMFGFPPTEGFTPTRWLNDGDVVTVGEASLEVLHCPGHTPGHVVFFHRGEQLAFVGDVLFQGSIGRTDFPQGDYDTLINAIKGKLLPLGDEVSFVPGHGPASTFGHERRHNPYLRG